MVKLQFCNIDKACISAYVEEQKYDANLTSNTLWEELGAHAPYFYLERMTFLVVSNLTKVFKARRCSLSRSLSLKIVFSEIRRYLRVKVTLFFRHLEYSTRLIMELCDRFMMMLPANMAMKLNEILPFQLMLFLLVLSCRLYTFSCKFFQKLDKNFINK